MTESGCEGRATLDGSLPADEGKTPEALDRIRAIAPEDVEFILRSAEGTESVIVGGQALNIWAEIYSDRAPEELARFGPHTSKDMDYWGMKDAANLFNERVGGKIQFPPAFDASPNTALVTFTRNGREIVVDFLATIAGIAKLDLERDTVQLALPLRNAAGEPLDEVEIILLRPLPILRARLANISILRRHDANTIRQANVAVIVAREYIGQLLDEEISELREGAGPVVAGRAVLELNNILMTPEAYDAWRIGGVDPVQILDHLSQLPGWHPKFLEKQISGKAIRLREVWGRRNAEARRRIEEHDAARARKGQ